MGKKKSTALIVLITIVLVGLLFLSFTPTFSVKSPNSFRSLLSIVDLGRDLDGGYYTVYYPEGVISKAEYETLKAEYDYVASNTEEGQTPSVENPEENYTVYKGIYLSNDIYASDAGVTETFASQFDTALKAVQARYEGMGFSDFSVRVQDDYTAESLAQSIFTLFSYSGDILFTDASTRGGTSTVQMEGSSENLSRASIADAGDSGYAVVLHFTSAGREAFRELTSTLASASSDSSSSSSSSSSSTLYIYVGDDQVMGAGVSEEMNQSSVSVTGGYTREQAQAIASLINSSIDEDDVIGFDFESPEYYSMDALTGTNTALIAAICIGVLFVAMIVFSLVKFKGMGLAHTYGFVTFLVAVVACISLIPGIQLTLGGIAAILLASAMLVSCNYYAFNNIKKEFATGKTLTASVKSGYKKSLAFTIDVHAILVLASLAIWLIATGAAKFMALIFLLSIAISAVCTLLVTRFYLYMFMAQPKNKIAFVGFKREETEDE